MPFDRDLATLIDIRDNIDLAFAFAEGHDAVSFLEDKKTYDSVVRCLEIVSEASRRLSDALKQRHSNIPWTQAASAGSIYRHGYDALMTDVVWDTFQQSLPPLRAVAAEEIVRLS
jgi:uncharacterized protein with HEPN domain